jgi:Mrp family chromosome partitioning ATPase
MWLVARGKSLTARSRGALATGRLRELISGLTDRAAIVLCDSSPVLLVPENLFLAAAADGVLLIARAGSTTCADLSNAKAALDDAGARVIGVVINEMPVSSLRSHYRRYYKAYMRGDQAYMRSETR